ncbi:MAG: ornithine carbamoyltransferase [Thaumarchaeota archaeon]|nr:MAG: ornithine carbamoyltransferase [Nitrososphaerota archaeon]
MVAALKGRDFLTLRDFSADEILEILKLAKKVKGSRNMFRGALDGRGVAMIFEKPSTRTRIFFEMAVSELGGTPIYLRPMEMQLKRGESLADTARVLSRYVSLIMARVYEYETLVDLAKWAEIPVVNGLSNINHPLQTLADLLTIWERFGRFREVKIAWIGDGDNVCNSLLVGAAKLGLNVAVATPKGYEPNKEFVDEALKEAERSGSSIEFYEDPVEAVSGADVVMTDTFVSMGMEAEAEKRLKIFLPKYQVTADLMKHAKPDAIFMHPLPAHRGQEVSAEVIDGERSAVWDQAENRLHTSKALLLMLLGSS